MHLLVLSAFRPITVGFMQWFGPRAFQCTFWCSVLSDPAQPASALSATCPSFNAPSGAQCFPTTLKTLCHERFLVSMHLLVLSAFRHKLNMRELRAVTESQCTFWCSVLSDYLREIAEPATLYMTSQCTFWCSVLSDKSRLYKELIADTSSQCTFWCSVLSDLLVLSAFRLGNARLWQCSRPCLNAPSGAQCFPTHTLRRRSITSIAVSMHLLVLSAFRPNNVPLNYTDKVTSQCTFWCSVLSDLGILLMSMGY